MSGEKKGNWKHQKTLALMTLVLVWELWWELWWVALLAASPVVLMAEKMVDRMAGLMADLMAVMLVGKMVEPWANLKVVLMDAKSVAVRAVAMAR